MAQSRFFPVIITSLILALLVGGGAAVAAKMITGKQIKNGTVTTKDVKNNNLKSKDLKNGTVSSKDIKNKTVATGDLANGSVTASKIAPGAIAFPNSLWGTVIRNQQGAAESNVQAGPGGQPLGDGSLRLFVTAAPDLAAFGNSFDFAAFPIADITDLSYATFNPDAAPAVRPSLRVELNPHLVADDTFEGITEFTTLIHEPANGTTGWQEHTGILDDADWYLTGTEGEDMGCTQSTPCTFTEIQQTLVDSTDDDPLAPAVSSGVYFALGAGVAESTDTAVDAFVFNGFQFDFEPMGVFVTPVS
jgi:hypothetical protein